MRSLCVWIAVDIVRKELELVEYCNVQKQSLIANEKKEKKYWPYFISVKSGFFLEKKTYID